MTPSEGLMEKIISLSKRRGFIFPGSELYGGLANAWDYGPLGAQLKKNIKDEWWRWFVERRADMVGIDAALLMNSKVWEASGHLKEFSDPLVEFKNIIETMRKRLPFGIASQGKAFRNEITPGNFIFRTREFDLMEFEYFVRASEWEQWFEYWLGEMKAWLAHFGVGEQKLHFHEIEEGERAHYSARTVDIEYEYPFGRKELYGLAYRSDFD